MRAAVIGAGIGGLAAAAALARLPGWQVEVHEQATSLEPVGAGISLWPNALRALDSIGLGDRVRALATLEGGNGIRRPDGRWLARSDLAPALRERYGDPLVLLTRAELVHLLRSAVPDGALRLGSRVTASEVVAAGSDLVVAADGLLSGTRQHLFPDHPVPVYAGYTAWRLLTDSPGDVPGSETWGGAGQRFAIVPLAAGRVYCYATAGVPAGTRSADEKAELVRRFGTWHAPIPAVLASVTAADVLHHDIYDLVTPLPSFGSTVAGCPVVLLGDSAHPMVPELGQGGCQAMEDAVTLAALLRRARVAGDIPAAVERYSALRGPRTAAIARRSRSALRLTQATGGAGMVVRDLAARVMGALPPGLVARGLAPTLAWAPPE